MQVTIGHFTKFVLMKVSKDVLKTAWVFIILSSVLCTNNNYCYGGLRNGVPIDYTLPVYSHLEVGKNRRLSDFNVQHKYEKPE